MICILIKAPCYRLIQGGRYIKDNRGMIVASTATLALVGAALKYRYDRDFKDAVNHVKDAVKDACVKYIRPRLVPDPLKPKDSEN